MSQVWAVYSDYVDSFASCGECGVTYREDEMTITDSGEFQCINCEE